MPADYSDAYQRAYRQSLAAHPTELMAPARPGKRAAEVAPRSRLRTWLEDLVAEVLVDARKRLMVGAGLGLVLVLLSYGAGRLAA